MEPNSRDQLAYVYLHSPSSIVLSKHSTTTYAYVQDRKRNKGRAAFVEAGGAISWANHWLLFCRSLCGLRLQAARQVPQFYEQVTKESFHILHVFQKNAHLVVQMGVRGPQRRSEAWLLSRRG